MPAEARMRKAGAPLLPLLVLTAACGSSSPAGLCGPATMCDEARPPPERFAFAATPLADGGSVRRLIGATAAEAGAVYGLPVARLPAPRVDGRGRPYRPDRLYFVADGGGSRGDVWIVPERPDGEAARPLRLLAGVDRRDLLVSVDGARGGPSLRRFALLDRRTLSGPTFSREYPRTFYVRYAPDSDYVRREWEQVVNSSCGGGTLTRVPDAWEQARARQCGR